MIAFTRQSQIAKMTTAHVAATTQAVLPISSARNVMAKNDSSLETACNARSRTEKRQSRKGLTNGTCKHCGCSFPAKHEKVFCSRECRTAYSFANKKEYRKFQCKACGKHNEGWEWKARKPKQVCGLKCQMQIALVVKHSKKSRIDWAARSIEAKKIWQRKRRMKRLATSVYGLWLRKAREQVSVFCRDIQHPWKARCTSARSLLARRLEPSIKQNNAKQVDNWVHAVCKAECKLSEESKRSKADQWTKKIVTVASSMRKRRQLRNAKPSA